MNCPKCGKEMNSGLLWCGNRPVLWVPKEWDWQRESWNIGEESGVQLNGLTWSTRAAAEKSPTAYHCADCCKIIVDY